MSVMTLSVGGVRVPALRVEGADSELAALRDRLPPPFLTAPTEPGADWTFTTEVAELESRWPGPERTVAEYRPGGTEPYLWVVETSSAGRRLMWVTDELSGERARLSVDQGTRSIEVATSQGNGRWSSRIVKSFYSAYLLAEGWQPVHASAVVFEGTAIVCAGERGSGKSSLAFLAARLKGAAYLSDDILFLRSNGSGDWDVLGWPFRVGVRRDLLGRLLGAAELETLAPKLRRPGLPARSHPRGDRLAFDIDELTGLLSVAYVGHVRAPVRFARIASAPTARTVEPWTTGPLDPDVVSRGFHLRYLTDALNLFGFERTAAGPERAEPSGPSDSPSPVRSASLELPYDLLADFPGVWELLTS